MNKYNQIDEIVNKFGGDKKPELRMKLNELVESEFEFIKNQNEIDENTMLQSQKHHITSDIMKLYSSDYDKCMRILDRLVRDKWYNLIIVPDDLRIEFFNQAECKHEIEFKMEDCYEFFKITDS